MKRILIISLILILILASGYGIYYFWSKQKPLDIWSLVPENALLVYENDNLIKSWNAVQENPVWEDLLQLDSFQEIKGNFESLDSLTGKNGALDDLFKNNPILISMHITSKDDFDFVFYQSINKSTQFQMIEEVEENLKELKQSQRTYENYTINELKDKTNKVVFSYLIIKSNFVGSFSPILIEDVIRNLEKEDKNFKNENEEIFKIAKFQNDAGNLFINFNRLNWLFKVFSGEAKNSTLQILQNFSGSTFLDFVFDDHQIYFNGYTFLSDSNTYLKIYENQKGGDITLENLLPARTALLVHERFDQPDLWYKETMNFWNKKIIDYQKDQKTTAEKYPVDIRNFHEFMSGENALAVLNNTTSKEETDKLVFIKMKDQNEGLNKFNKLAEEAAKYKGDTLYYEFYAGKEIRELVIEEFPYWLLGPNYAGFENTFYTVFNDFIVLSNNIQSIKTMVLDIETESTWGKSIKQNQFLESTLQESNLSIIVNNVQAWPMLVPALNEKWSAFFKENEYPLKNLELVAMQFSNESDKFYTNIEMNHYESEIATDLEYFNVLQSVRLSLPITSKPFVVKNHDTGLFETIVQDSSNTIHLIGTNGSILWSEPLGKPIISEVFQIDFYKNNKLQYAFATEEKVYILDRNGIGIENYPIELTNEDGLKHFNVIDYDKSKNYRFITSTQAGDIYLTDKYGKTLGEWSPMKLGDKIASIPEHIRIRSKDFMVALQENGTVNVMSRNGEMKPNFPIKIEDRLSDNLFFEVGNSFEKSYLVTLTNGGELVKLSFTGKVDAKSQLYKPTKETIFKIIPDATGRTYLLARQDLNRVSMLNGKGELMFDKDYLSREEMGIQYYQFAAEKELIAITDKVQEFTYIYTKDGTLINSQPIESNNEVAMIYYGKDNSIHIYKCHNNTFSILKFNF